MYTLQTFCLSVGYSPIKHMYACVIHLYSAGLQQRKVTPHNKNKEYSLWREFIAQQYHFLVKAGPDTSIDESGMVAL